MANMRTYTVGWVAALLLLAGCRGHKEKAYIADAPRNERMEIKNTYPATLLPDDLLYIYVYSQTPESTVRFNEETNRGKSAVRATGYRVSQSGSIMFPVLGRLDAAGKSTSELASDIERRLRDGNYVNDAIVTVKLLNFHVAVIGEVKRPSLLHSDNSRLTIFEALARCGDITSDGMRTNVVVVRHDTDMQIVDTLDLTRAEVLNSPYYYLQQNDIVFVEPTPKKRRRAYRDEDWPKYMSSSISVISMAWRTIYTIWRRTS